jgi:hypothetical protein
MLDQSLGIDVSQQDYHLSFCSLRNLKNCRKADKHSNGAWAFAMFGQRDQYIGNIIT